MADDSPSDDAPTDGALGEAELRSTASTNFPRILEHAGITLALTAHQSGILAFLRRDGSRINTYTMPFDRPMGIATHKASLALGTRTTAWGFTNYPGAATAVDPSGRADACYVPQTGHVTGDINIHDLAFDAEGVLWAVATRFSCLVNFEAGASFLPKWRPSFVTELAGDDRCHLNGLAMVEGRPKYVTVLSTTDTAEGWKGQTEPQGAVLDVDTGEIVASGLWYPHSPRWHKGKLWFLESGAGGLCTVDIDTGEVTTVATLPGFTRGLTFAGDLAFVGLSKGRSSQLEPLPIIRQPQSLECGVWAIDTVTGAPLGRFNFTGSVDEIYEVTALSGVARPELVTPDAPAVADIIVVEESFMTDSSAWARLAPGAN